MNASTRTARALVAALLDHGVRDVVLCPGSRSAPLAYALHEAELAGRLRLHVRHDERSAAFCALGFGKADPSAPAAVVTTSGTAAANLHPAVLEAHHSDVPLLVLTADRPHRLRGTWANQTTGLQAGLFGSAVRSAVDVFSSGASDGAALWRGHAAAAVATARGEGGRRPGPVHLDLAFDDPLPPDLDDDAAVWPSNVLPLGESEAPAPDSARDGSLAGGPRTVVVAGDGAGPQARRLAELRGWPLLAEPTSNARGGPNAVGPYRLLLDEPSLGGRVERAVVLGRPTLSRQVARLVARADVEVVQVVRWDDDPGPLRHVTRVVGPLDLGSPGQADRHGAAWLASWQVAGSAAAQAIDEVLDKAAAGGVMSGPLVAREVGAAHDGTHERLVVAASNPVRDLDVAFAPPSVPGRDRAVLANRGLAGIDGTVSTATGVALATGLPTRVLVGDLAFLHDLAALAVPARERAAVRLQVVVLNDDGGGIFALLEHGEPLRAKHFERVFGTPHGADLAALCAGFGVPHAAAVDLEGLRTALSDVPNGLSVVEVRADRDGLRDLHARLRETVGAAVRSALVSGSAST